MITKEKAFLAASWLESLLYGFFVCLFVVSLQIHAARREKTTHMRIMLYTSVIMFVLATLHVGTNCYQISTAYVDYRTSPKGPVGYIDNLASKDRILQVTLYVTQSIIGDAVAIYRCFVVWNRGWLIMIIPILLMIVSAVSGYVAIALHTSEAHNASIYTLRTWIRTFYSTAVVQTLFTTGAIAFKIWMVDRQTANYYRSGKSSTIPVLRILVESAALTLVAEVLLLAFYLAQNNAQQILLQSVTPIIGISFSAVTIRITMRSRTLLGGAGGSSSNDRMPRSGGGGPVAAAHTIGSIPMHHVISVGVSREVEDDAIRTVDEGSMRKDRDARSESSFMKASPV